MTTEPDPELDAFLAGDTDPAGFSHARHVDMARRLLDRFDFLEAARLYDRALARITARAGVPEKRSVTKTLAFLALIGETGEAPHPGLLDTWYSPERLADPRGRDTFLMPDRFTA
jgi:hypothetical protein